LYVPCSILYIILNIEDLYYYKYVHVFKIDTIKKKTSYWMVRYDFYVCEVFSKLLLELGHVKVIKLQSNMETTCSF